MKYVAREISIMRQLSKLDQNEYTTSLYDIIIPEKACKNMDNLKELFLVMEYVPYDLSDLLN